jgi:DNA-binding XRE family transcriptional regulator
MSKSTQLATLVLVAMLTDMLRRDRERWGVSEAKAARRFGISLRTYRGIEAGEELFDFDAYSAMCRLFGWPQAFIQPAPAT